MRAGLKGKNQKIIEGYIRNDLFTATLKMLPQVVKGLRKVLQSIVLKSTFNHCVRSWCHVLTQTNSKIKWTYTGSAAVPLCIMLEQWLSGEKYDVKLRRVIFFFYGFFFLLNKEGSVIVIVLMMRTLFVARTNLFQLLKRGTSKLGNSFREVVIEIIL